MSEFSDDVTASGVDTDHLDYFGETISHTPEGGTPSSYSAIVDDEETERFDQRGRDDEAYGGYQAVYRTRQVKLRVSDLADVGDRDKFTIGVVDYFPHRDGKEPYKRLGPTWLFLILCRPEADESASPNYRIA